MYFNILGEIQIEHAEKRNKTKTPNVTKLHVLLPSHPIGMFKLPEDQTQ